MNQIVQAIILGLVEGLTEFIPVSSTGHLILFTDLLNFSIENKESFSIFIQLGAILAVVFIYRERFLKLLKKDSLININSNQLTIFHIIIASLPVFITGFLFHKYIKEVLFSVTVVAYSLIVGGVVLLFIEKLIKKDQIEDVNKISYKQSLLVGIIQCLSLCPGVSRSGATIVGGLCSGLNKKVAAEFSFIVAVPVMFVAVLYDLYKTIAYLSIADFELFLVGFIVSFIVAILAIKFFMGFLNKFSLVPFGIYRIILGLLILIYIS
jgi:undecaprenyl-diphosphatase